MTVRNTFSLKKPRTSFATWCPEIRPLVEHRQQHAFDVERRIEADADAAHRADEIGEAFEGEVLAVERNQHGIGGDECVQRQQPERRRAVDQDVVVALANAREKLADAFLAVRQRNELDLSAGQVLVRRDHIEPLDRRGERVGLGIEDRFRPGQRVVDRAAFGQFALLADAARQIALRVEVDEQDALSEQGERRAEVDGRSWFFPRLPFDWRLRTGGSLGQ